MKEEERRYEEAARVLPGRLRALALTQPPEVRRLAEEFRLRAGRPLAVLLPEGESSGEKLYALMTGLLSDAPRREAMSRALRDMAVPDAAEQIYQTLVRLMEKRAN